MEVGATQLPIIEIKRENPWSAKTVEAKQWQELICPEELLVCWQSLDRIFMLGYFRSAPESRIDPNSIVTIPTVKQRSDDKVSAARELRVKESRQMNHHSGVENQKR